MDQDMPVRLSAERFEPRLLTKRMHNTFVLHDRTR
jgi:hypothetical protein